MDNMNLYYDEAIKLVIGYAPKLILALLTLLVGLWIIKLLSRAVMKMLSRSKVDQSLQGFLSSLTSMTLKVLLVISVAGMLGIEMTSFIAILGAAGLAVGMALSGTLQNFAGGVMILIFRPYKVGDFVEMQGFSGVVKEIQIFNTILTTGDNKTIILPNAPIASGSVVNYSTQPRRRVDFTFGIGYRDDIDRAKKVILSTIVADERVLSDPEPFIAVSELAESSVNFVVRVWAQSGDYWGVYFSGLENVKKALDRERISIPYPQQDLHFVSGLERLKVAANA